MGKLKDYISFATSLIIHTVAEYFEKIELIALQKLFYILSILILLIGIVQLLSKRKAPKKGNKFVDALVNTQKANKVIELADDPEQTTKKVVVTFNTIKKGGSKVMKFFKTLSVVQLVSFILTLILLLVGVLSAFVPELSFIGAHFETFLITVGLASSPGILSKGKELGEVLKGDNKKKVLKALKTEIKSIATKLAELEVRYADVIRLAADVAELGGRLTPDQEIAHQTYLTQKKALEDREQEEKRKLEEAEQDV